MCGGVFGNWAPPEPKIFSALCAREKINFSVDDLADFFYTISFHFPLHFVLENFLYKGEGGPKPEIFTLGPWPIFGGF